MPIIKIKIVVEIDLGYTTTKIAGDEIDVEYKIINGVKTIYPSCGLFYNDRRVTNFYVGYKEFDNNWYYIKFKATNSTYENISYYLCDEIQLEDGKKMDFVNIGVDVRANRIFVSMPYQYRNLLGRRTLTVGGVDEKVIAVESSALEVSDGQYGQYPLYVFCDKNIYALEIDKTGDKFATNIVPYSINEYIRNEYSVATKNRVIFFISKEGLKIIPKLVVLSEILNGEYGNWENDLNSGCKLVFYENVKKNRDEVWVITKEKTYCFSLKYKKWFTCDKYKYSNYFYIGKDLFGIINDSGKNIISLIQGGVEKAVGQIEMNSMHFGEPEVLKRLRGMAVKFKGLTKVIEKFASRYEYYYADYSVKDTVLYIDAVIEPRYIHRPKIKIDTVVKGYLSGYCGIYCNKYPY